MRIVSRADEEKEKGRKRRIADRSVEETAFARFFSSWLSLDILNEATTDKDTARVTNSTSRAHLSRPLSRIRRHNFASFALLLTFPPIL